MFEITAGQVLSHAVNAIIDLLKIAQSLELIYSRPRTPIEQVTLLVSLSNCTGGGPYKAYNIRQRYGGILSILITEQTQ
jgi:hypothetical protein